MSNSQKQFDRSTPLTTFADIVGVLIYGAALLGAFLLMEQPELAGATLIGGIVSGLLIHLLSANIKASRSVEFQVVRFATEYFNHKLKDKG